ncbi:hypothetical protein J7643_06830 [bacterium]|nr:hypothetical protein [bacterium]
MLSREVKELRFAFLQKVYEHTAHLPRALTYLREIGTTLGCNYKLLEMLSESLRDDGLLEFKGPGGAVRISKQGILEVERLLSAAPKPTDRLAVPAEPQGEGAATSV